MAREQAKALDSRRRPSTPRWPRSDRCARLHEKLGARVETSVPDLVKAVREDVLDKASDQGDRWTVAVLPALVRKVTAESVTATRRLFERPTRWV